MRSVVLTVCAALVAGASTSSVLLAANFTTANGRIYDPNGNDYVARGVNIPGHNYWTGHDPVPDVTKIVDNWGFNMVRVVNLPFADWQGPGHHINLDQIIETYTARGVVTMVEVHEATGSYFEGAALTEAANWFGNLAAKYKNNPYVWFNTANEPGNMAKPTDPAKLADWDIWTPDGEKWLTMNRTIISAIRAAGNNNVVVVDGTNGGQDQAWDDLGTLNRKHSAILTYGPTLAAEFDNVVFDAHMYGEWSSPGAIPGRLRQYIEAVQAADLPLVFGEYGATVWGDWYNVQVEFLKLANEYKLGRAAWAWADVGGWNLTTGEDPTAIGRTWQYGGGYLIDNPSSPTNLSAFGKLVWADNHPIIPIPEPATFTTLAICSAACLVRRRRAA